MSKPFIHDPKLDQKIDKLWAWLSVDEDGNSGICATGKVDDANGVIQHFPLVTADPRKIKALQAIADEMTQYSEKKIVMAEFIRVIK